MTVLSSAPASPRPDAPDTDPPPASTRATNPEHAFCGRERELALLGGLVTGTADGARLACVDGPAGIGKTALVRELLHRHPVRACRVAGEENESTLPYGLLGRLLDRLPAAADGGTRGASLRDVADPFVAGARLLDALGQSKDDTPLVVVLDDAQWADVPSLDATAFALRRLGADRVLAVVVTRDAADPAVPEGMRRLLADDDTVRLTLGPLGVADIAGLAARLLDTPLPSHAAARLHDHTGGNPLHVRALLREVPAEVLAGPDDSLPAPRSYSLLVLARLARCDRAAQDLVAAASVLGTRCDLREAARLADVADPLPAVEQAIGQDLLRERFMPGTHEVCFPHPLVRASVYHHLGPVLRTRLHTRAAEAATDPFGALWHRLGAADGTDEVLAADLASVADDEAAAGHWSGCATLARHAFRMAPSGPGRDRLAIAAADALLADGRVDEAAALIKALAGASTAAGHRCADSPEPTTAEHRGAQDSATTGPRRGHQADDPDTAEPTHPRHTAAAGRTGPEPRHHTTDPDRTGPEPRPHTPHLDMTDPGPRRCAKDPGAATAARQRYAEGHLAFVRGQLADAWNLLGDAWAHCDPAADPALAQRIAERLAALCLVHCRGEEAARWAERATALSTAPAKGGTLRYCHLVALGMTGAAERGVALTRDLPAAALVPPEDADLLLGRGLLRMWSDDLEEGRDDLLAAARMTRLGPVPLRVLADTHLGQAEFRAGRWDEAVLHLGVGCSVATDAGQAWLAPFGHAELAMVLALRDDRAGAAAHLAEARRVLGDARDVVTLMAMARSRAWLAMARGDHPEAVRALRPLLDLRTPAEPAFLPWHDLLAHAQLAVGALQECAATLARLDELTQATGRRSALAAASRVRGGLLAARQRPEAAEEALRTGLRHAATVENPFDSARLALALGIFLRRTGRRAAGAEYLLTAHGVFTQLGAVWLAGHCARELAACGQPVGPGAATPLSLTPQELAVARLAADGLSNRRIAHELVLSVKTVEYHLSHVYAKLGIASRSELPAKLAPKT
ncbi:AAA family ATPase [Streptomyces sp. NPDC051243]|uniref:helix-turn-helix transcriptional regulator n=1 Tax=Streptomyces sp. NPDC051243 TaxID=3365646 RepID=UPI0037A3C5AD